MSENLHKINLKYYLLLNHDLYLDRSTLGWNATMTRKDNTESCSLENRLKLRTQKFGPSKIDQSREHRNLVPRKSNKAETTEVDGSIFTIKHQQNPFNH